MPNQLHSPFTLWTRLKTIAGIKNVVEDLTPQLGGNLDTNGKKINAITQTNAIQNASKLLQAEDIMPASKYIPYGLVPATSANLTSNISAGVAYVTGVRVKKAITAHTYTASKDTYVDLSSVGTYAFVEVANGAGEPAITSDSMRVAKVVTDGDNITGVTKYHQYNTYLGYQSGSNNTTGGFNTGVGGQALRANTTGYDNTAIGSNALIVNTTGHSNSALGRVALQSNTTGIFNTAIGMYALSANTTGHYNSAMGRSALERNQTGSCNVVLGAYAGRGVSGNSHSNNVFIGYQAGYSVTTGSTNIVIGYDQDLSAPDVSNEMNIGGVLYGDLSNKRIGIGIVSPTAKLHLPACTASANTASLKIDPGTFATTPVSGNIESDGTHLYWTNSAGTRLQLDN